MTNVVFKKAIKKFTGALERKKFFVEGNTVSVGGTVTVPGTENLAYVRINGINTIVKCDPVAHVKNIPVWVGVKDWQLGVYQVLNLRDRFDVPTATDWTIGTHHERHEWQNIDGGDDVVFVHARQFMPMRVKRSSQSPLKIKVEVGYIELSDGWYRVEQAEVLDLSSYQPASDTDACYVLVYVDDSGTVQVTAGDTVSDKVLLEPSDIPKTPSGSRSLAAVRLYNGQTEISENVYENDMIDLRFPGFGIGSGSTPSTSGGLRNAAFVEHELDYLMSMHIVNGGMTP